MSGWRRLQWLALLAFSTGLVSAWGADPATSPATAEVKAALAPLQGFVGKWKGVGQIRRGSAQGAWTEKADWAWQFNKGAALVFQTPEGKYFASGRLTAGDEAGKYELAARPPEAESDERYIGQVEDDGQLVLLADDEDAGKDAPARISLRMVADGDRLVVLYERRVEGTDRFTRLAEVGYTRLGSSFAKGSGKPECVVTGGLGTIEVQYAGKKYYVCCAGCRDLFDEDPERVLADYKERKEKEREEARAAKEQEGS